MQKLRNILVSASVLTAVVVGLSSARERFYFFPTFAVGAPIDSLHGVYVFYNGSTGNVGGRNRATDGYNLGLRYQCVEFVKRYYYEHFHHKMPDASGHARAFFDPAVADGAVNRARDLRQYRNGGRTRPALGDILVFGASTTNPYGHVAIVSAVENGFVELVQQNGGAWVRPRIRLRLVHEGGRWRVDDRRLLGWLRRE